MKAPGGFRQHEGSFAVRPEDAPGVVDFFNFGLVYLASLFYQTIIDIAV